MKLLDVNVLVYAHREDAPGHRNYAAWLRDLLGGEEPFAVTSLVFTGFIRIVTHRRVFDPPSPLEIALAFAREVRTHDNCVVLEPGHRHWDIFEEQCRGADARGNLVTDAHLAALAVETASDIITTDRDFSRFPNLRWSHPLG
ncbi:type II toxin-antitoxin system VapC family toxin [Phytoactinopolyspora mesophila]|uniref:Ribonuclease VapC n=1 Tax=Phytoactinopolyspora mesophila TaxID=2650750 RepID=A0A7K3MB39_9ACTN|nr:type II toxin-antitoxin system VapC family toxin [Phytoactinopolyspora mesophila]NDL60535.1 PIN domain-containing protein [Phytoactinopolyspora mesophila]